MLQNSVAAAILMSHYLGLHAYATGMTHLRSKSLMPQTIKSLHLKLSKTGLGFVVHGLYLFMYGEKDQTQ